MKPPQKPASAPSDHQAWDEFVGFLKKNGSRVTEARRIVFDKVMDHHDHFRADDLAAELAMGSNRVSRGTVYRVLTLMVESGFVRTVGDGDSHSHYEHVYGHSRHEHMVCERCHRFIEFDAPDLIKSIEKHCRRQRFQYGHHRVSIFGVCEDCAQKAGKQGRRTGN